METIFSIILIFIPAIIIIIFETNLPEKIKNLFSQNIDSNNPKEYLPANRIEELFETVETYDYSNELLSTFSDIPATTISSQQLDIIDPPPGISDEEQTGISDEEETGFKRLKRKLDI